MVITTSLRIPDDLHTAIADLAEQEDRSFNWTVVNLLRERLEQLDSEGDLCFSRS